MSKKLSKDKALNALCGYADSKLKEGKLLIKSTGKSYTIEELYNIIKDENK